MKYDDNRVANDSALVRGKQNKEDQVSGKMMVCFK
jgi:hypothetical protein